MKLASIVIICSVGLALTGCESLETNAGSASDPTAFKGDLNNLGGPAFNAPDVNAPRPRTSPTTP